MKKEDEDMEVPQYDLNDIIEMKKEHPCHKSKQWKICLLYTSDAADE